MKSGNQSDDPLRQNETERNSDGNFDHELAEQDAGDFSPSEAENPQTCQFPRTLLQSNSCTIVHNADRDDHRKRGEDASGDEDEAGDLVEKRRQGM